MIRPRILFWFSVTILCLLIAAPVLAAMVECPSTCSCLLPAKAKELGYPGYCGGKQAVCNYDAAKNPMYCYQKPITTIPDLKPIVTTVKPTVTITATVTTTMVPQCPSGCLCISAVDAKAKGLSYCNGKQTLCGYDTYQTPLYCFAQPTQTTTTTKIIPTTTTISLSKVSPTPTKAPGTPTTTVTPRSKDTPVPTEIVRPILTGVVERTTPIRDAVPCRANFSCLDEGTIRAKGYTIDGGQPDTCGYSMMKGVLYCAQSPDGSEPSEPQEDPGIVGAVLNFFGSLFGVQSAPSLSPQPTAYLEYCQQRYGLDSCNGNCVNLSTDVDNCGGCGDWCHESQRCYNGRCVAIYSDPENCGGFGNVCPEGAPCVMGYCSALGCMDPGLTVCNNSCVNTSFNELNCGSCGNVCAENEQCRFGVCEPCAPGNVFCRYSFCTNITKDNENCGQCQHKCIAGQSCIDGVCIGECPTGTTVCEESCVDLRTRDDNCGSCGNECSRIFWLSQHCENGECRW